VSLRQRGPRSVHSCCVGCVIEPRNTLIAGAEAVFAAERNMNGTVMRGAIHPVGVGEHITRGKIASETGRSLVWPRVELAVRIGKVKSRSR
jgi:hypothetical protein